MSCFDEFTYAIYADGELPEDQRAGVENHLIGCLACRERVVALSNEAELLGEVLHERRRVPRAEPARAPAQSLALGLGPTLLAGGAITAALGWLLETGAPFLARWLGPLSPRGAYEMAFDLIFLLRDEAPTALAFATAVAAMASASAFLTLLLSALLRRFPSGGAYGFALALALIANPSDGYAHFGFHQHDSFELAAGETHDGTLFVSAESADINGVVEGDLVVFAHTLTVRGEVRGNVLAVSRTYEQTGVVAGSVHVGAIRTHLAGRVDGNFYAAGEDLNIASDAKIGRDAAVAAERGVIEGSVGRDLYAAGERIEMRGDINRHVWGWAMRLEFLDESHVRGDVHATLPKGESIVVSSGARIDGETSTEERAHKPGAGLRSWLTARHWALLVLHVAAGVVVALMLRFVVPSAYASEITTPAGFFRALGAGFVFVVAAPFALAIVALTIVGIPLAMIGFATYLTTLYVGMLLFAFLVGSSLLAPDGSWSRFGLVVVAGLSVLVILVHLPIVGALFRIVAVIAGTGLATERALSAWRARTATAS